MPWDSRVPLFIQYTRPAVSWAHRYGGYQLVFFFVFVFSSKRDYFVSCVIPAFDLDSSTPLICIMNHCPWDFGEQKFKALYLSHNYLLKIGKTPVYSSTESITIWLISCGRSSPHWLGEHYIFETISLALKWWCLIDMTSILTIIYLIGSIKTAYSPKPLIQLIRPLSNLFFSWVCVDTDQVAISPKIGMDVNKLFLDKVSDHSQIIQITLITDKS